MIIGCSSRTGHALTTTRRKRVITLASAGMDVRPGRRPVPSRKVNGGSVKATLQFKTARYIECTNLTNFNGDVQTTDHIEETQTFNIKLGGELKEGWHQNHRQNVVFCYFHVFSSSLNHFQVLYSVSSKPLHKTVLDGFSFPSACVSLCSLQVDELIRTILIISDVPGSVIRSGHNIECLFSHPEWDIDSLYLCINMIKNSQNVWWVANN